MLRGDYWTNPSGSTSGSVWAALLEPPPATLDGITEIFGGRTGCRRNPRIALVSRFDPGPYSGVVRLRGASSRTFDLPRVAAQNLWGAGYQGTDTFAPGTAVALPTQTIAGASYSASSVYTIPDGSRLVSGPSFDGADLPVLSRDALVWTWTSTSAFDVLVVDVELVDAAGDLVEYHTCVQPASARRLQVTGIEQSPWINANYVVVSAMAVRVVQREVRPGVDAVAVVSEGFLGALEPTL